MKTILITGANRGIGLELVKQYLADDWQVIACSRHPLNLPKNEKLQWYSLDVTDANAIVELSNKLKNIPIDVLYNNAGVWGGQGFGETSAEEWMNVLRVNTIAPLLMAQAFIKQLAAGKVKIIVNMSSGMASISENTDGGAYSYRSSKAALNMLTKTLAIDLKSQGITVVSMDPGWVKTDMGGKGAQITPEESVQGIRRVLKSLTPKESGSFLSYRGNMHEW